MLAEDDVDLWKCAAIDLMSGKKGGGCMDGLCNLRPLAARS